MSKGLLIFFIVLGLVVVPLSSFLTVRFMGEVLKHVGRPKPAVQAEVADMQILEFFDGVVSENITAVRNSIRPVDLPDLSEEEVPPVTEEIPPVRKQYWIEEGTLVAPEPNQALFGRTDDREEMAKVLHDARWLLDGQKTYFQPDQQLYADSIVRYYLDDSIFAITWQEVHSGTIYTFSEIKVSHPSQFRRHLSNNAYDSGAIHPVSRMAGHTNAVLASSADFYMARFFGILVYQGEVKHHSDYDLADICFIDRNGDLILVPTGELATKEEAQAFVDSHDIDFSLAFGPILVSDGVRCEPDTYYLGEVIDKYPRVALCQKDKLHYVIVTANAKGAHRSSITIRTFADQIEKLNCQQAYTLDGGRTGTVTMNGKVLNPIVSSERWISDIIYFATAIPSTEEESVS
jgi:exopolysaccharide biosynthesis protein